MTEFGETDRLAEVRLKEPRPVNRPPAIQQEVDIAIFDLVEENRFRLAPRDGGAASAPAGPYRLALGVAERMLLLEIAPENDETAQPLELRLSFSPLRAIIKDYFAICESYFDAVKRLPPSRIEAIDMGRRGVHDEGARILAERLEGKVEADHDTYRRLFTLICALQYRG